MPKAPAKRAREEDERPVQLKAWLKELDAKEGLMKYYDALITECDGDLTQIAAARIERDPRLESGGGMGEWTPNGISNLQILLKVFYYYYCYCYYYYYYWTFWALPVRVPVVLLFLLRSASTVE